MPAPTLYTVDARLGDCSLPHQPLWGRECPGWKAARTAALTTWAHYEKLNRRLARRASSTREEQELMLILIHASPDWMENLTIYIYEAADETGEYPAGLVKHGLVYKLDLPIPPPTR
jgi:hypothetical protein